MEDDGRLSVEVSLVEGGGSDNRVKIPPLSTPHSLVPVFHCLTAEGDELAQRSYKANYLLSTSSWWQRPSGNSYQGCTPTKGAGCTVTAGCPCRAGTGREEAGAGSRRPSGSLGVACVCFRAGA